jgi:16S rRNA processing protein RimM
MTAVRITVGRIGRPHGLRGEVTVEVRTDEPERRFADGSVLLTNRDDQPRLHVLGSRWHQSALLLSLQGIEDRTAAESLRNTILEVEVDPLDRPTDDDEFYDHQLRGLTVRTADGEVVGTIADIAHLPGQDLLVVDAGGREVLIPFATEIVPQIDLAAGVVIVTPPPGLLNLDEEPAS